MRFALLSDIHGNVAALDAVLADIASVGVDAHVCLGDLVAFGPRPVEVLERLEAIEDLMIVRGNTDRWLKLVRDFPSGPFAEEIVGKLVPTLAWTNERLRDDRIEALDALPTSGLVEWDGGRLRIEHGSPGSDWVGIRPDEEHGALQAMLAGLDAHGFACGHTHQPFVRTVDGLVVTNDGSVGFPYDGVPLPSWAAVDVGRHGVTAEVRRVDYDRDSTVEDLAAVGLPRADVMARRIRTARM